MERKDVCYAFTGPWRGGQRYRGIARRRIHVDDAERRSTERRGIKEKLGKLKYLRCQQRYI